MGYTTYLKLDGVTGECAEETHRGWLGVDSFNHSLSGALQGAAAAAADVSIAKFVDRTTPLLARATLEGRIFPEAVIELCRTDGTKARFLELRLSRVRVTMHTLSGGGPQADVQTPYENFMLGFEKIEWNYFPAAFEAKREAAAEVRTGWNSQSALATA